MRLLPTLLFAVPALALTLSHATDVSACGGCFAPPPVTENEDTQVSSHRMIFSVSPMATTLWDQITYTGEPASFAWVLPIKGLAMLGVSSDALFQNLDQQTQVTVVEPQFNCP